MKKIRIKYALIATLALFAVAFISERIILNKSFTGYDLKRFSNTLHHKQAELEALTNNMAIMLNQVDLKKDTTLAFQPFSRWTRHLNDEESAIIISQNGIPLFWTSNKPSFSIEIEKSPKGLVKLPNGVYLIDHFQHRSYTIHTLILIKTEFSIGNSYLKNEFASEFHLPNSYGVSSEKRSGSYEIDDRNGQYLFSIIASNEEPCVYSDLYLPAFLYFLGLISFIYLLLSANIYFFHEHFRAKQIFNLLILSTVYILVAHFEKPTSIFLLNLFSPQYFAYTNYWSSLGTFILFSALIFVWSLCFCRTYVFEIHSNSTKKRIAFFVRFLLLAIFLLFINWLAKILVLNSSLSFALYRIKDMNIYTLLGLSSILFLYISFLLISIRVSNAAKKQLSNKEISGIIFASVIALTVINFIWPSENFIWVALFFVFLTITCFFYKKDSSLGHKITMSVIDVTLFAIFTLIILINLENVNEQKIQELKAANLYREHDPTAELYLIDIDKKMATDTTIFEMMGQSIVNLEAYLSRRYFNGYLREYDLQVTVCDETDSLIIQPENEVKECLNFFDEMIQNNGFNIPGTSVYSVDNMNGRITYIAKYEWKLFENEPSINLYIELNSRLLSEGAGFPELLMPKSAYETGYGSSMSYARYYNGELTDRNGDFLYALNISAYNFPPGKTARKQIGNHEHFAYNIGEDDYIVVTRKIPQFYEYMKAFPYLFIYFFAIALVIVFMSHRRNKTGPAKQSLQSRIQWAIIGIVLMTLLVAGSGTIFYNLSRHKTNHRQDLTNKINSVSTEINLMANEFDRLSPFLGDYLTNELIRISEVFYTDINIFDTHGMLLATSRPEIFEKGLISDLMNSDALFDMTYEKHLLYIHNESVGKMKFLSAYVPLINTKGDIIGFINIPYFTNQQQFTQEITTFILAFINLYAFLLMISILVAYYISGRITEPLKLVMESVKSIHLGRNTNPIEYHSEDEIGLLVNEYNKKLAELAESTELLAKSEREMAWREMARQIAHEIKNPLTPMKLNIQFLQRTQTFNTPEEAAKNKRITNILIEQIDNLSSIATEFSNFAKMPKAKIELFDPAQKLHETIGLYTEIGQSQIIEEFEPVSEFLIEADKEQFSRVIINLIRNAIQAMPEGQKGLVSISLKDQGSNIEIEVADNGKGIPDDLKDKIFVPNFTTKSSGTGLGLAISKNIIESFDGSIRFESKNQEGTSFFICLPKHIINEKNH